MRLIDADDIRYDKLLKTGNKDNPLEWAASRTSIDATPTIFSDTNPITQKALEAGKRGEEVKFYIGGRKFAVRELAQ